MKTTIHTRAMRGLSIREAAKDSGYIGVLEGHAAVFNSDSLEFAGYGKPWVERIAPGAFKRTLTEQPDVKALWSHRADAILARSPDTLKLSEDATGLHVEISLIDTQQNRDILTSIRAKIIDAMSFGFSARSVKWDEGKEQDVRTLLDVDLFEVSAVVWPAYPGASVSARSAMLTLGNDASSETRAIADERTAHFAQSVNATKAAEEARQSTIRGMAVRFL